MVSRMPYLLDSDRSARETGSLSIVALQPDLVLFVDNRVGGDRWVMAIQAW